MENIMIIICAMVMAFCLVKANQLDGKCASKTAKFGLLMTMVGDVLLSLDVLYNSTIPVMQFNQTMALAVILMLCGYYLFQANVACSKKRQKHAQ